MTSYLGKILEDLQYKCRLCAMTFKLWRKQITSIQAFKRSSIQIQPLLWWL